MVTADAMHTQTKLADYLVTEKHAGYLLVAKDNQPTSRTPFGRWRPKIFPRPAETWDKGHGRTEYRGIRVSTDLNNSLTCPHVGQVFRLERTVTHANASTSHMR